MGRRIVMETKAAANKEAVIDLGECTSTVFSLPPLPVSLHDTGGSNENIMRIDRALFWAAVEGNFNKFKNIENSDMKKLLTPNKNTILHIHLTSTTSETAPYVSLTFVQQILIKSIDLFFPQKISSPGVLLRTLGTPVSEKFVRQILDKFRDLVLLPNAKGETLLHIAARYGHSNIARLLLDRVKALDIGAEKEFIGATNNEKDTALHEAVRYHHIEIVKTLLEEDPDYSNYTNNDNRTPLYLASERQYRKVVREILKKVKSPAYVGPNNRTALHAAVINEDIEMARDLLQNEHVKVAIQHVDKKGWIPLHYAVETGNEELTKLLLKQDENTAYTRDHEGRTALHIAAYGGYSRIMEMIIEDYPDCSELVDNNGWNALHYAVNGGKRFTVDSIMRNLSLSNLYNEKDVRGNTPLHHLANSHLLSERLVSHHRVDKQAVNRKDQNALDVAFGIIEDSESSKKDNKKDIEDSDRLTKQGLITRLISAGAKQSQLLDQKSKNGQEKSDGLAFPKEVKESTLLVATVITTVSFAAGITLPGGTIQDGKHKGTPLLGQRTSFKIFIICNAIAMVLAATAALTHLFTPLIKVKRKDYDYLLSAFVLELIFYAVIAMLLAFFTGTYAVLGSSSIGIAFITIGICASYFLSWGLLALKKFSYFR